MSVDIILLTDIYCYTTVYLLSVTIIGIIVTISYLMWSNQPEKIKFVLINDKAASPERGTQRSAGYDLKSCEDCVIPARSHKAVKTGIKVTLPTNTYGRVASRSGLSFKNGIEVGAGVIDEDYRNELMVILHNHSDLDFKIEVGSRIAQLIVERVVYPNTMIEDFQGKIQHVNTCIRSIRGLGGFGSTGLK